MAVLTGFTAKGHQGLVSPAHILLGQNLSGFNGVGATMTTIGLSSGAISINRSITRVPLSADQLNHVYGSEEGEIATTVEAAMDQNAIYNLALALSVPFGQITSSSILTIDASTVNPYRSMQVRSRQAKPLSTDSSTGSQTWEFYKVKIFQNGAIQYGRDAKTVYPIVAECFGNDSDVLGRVTFTVVGEAAPGGNWGDTEATS